MGLYEAVLTQSYAGQRMVNRFNYTSSGTPAAVLGAFALCSGLGAIAAGTPAVYPTDSLLWSIADLQQATVTFVGLTVLNVYDPTDFYSTPFVPPLVGTKAGEGLSPINAYGFRSTQTNRSIRRGMKRFTGVVVEAQGNGGNIDSGFYTLLQTVADRMGENIEYDDEGQTITFQPVIVSKQAYTPDPDAPTTAYRYYPTLIEQMQHVASSVVWEYYTTVRSQTSRQVGRGV